MLKFPKYFSHVKSDSQLCFLFSNELRKKRLKMSNLIESLRVCISFTAIDHLFQMVLKKKQARCKLIFSQHSLRYANFILLNLLIKLRKLNISRYENSKDKLLFLEQFFSNMNFVSKGILKKGLNKFWILI